MPLNPIGSEFRVNTYTSDIQRTFFESPKSVAIDADGGFVVTWSSNGQDGNGNGVYAQRYNSAGIAQGSEFRVNTYIISEQQNSTVAMDADGDFVITWTSNGQDSSLRGVYARRYNAAGVAQGSEFRVNTYTTSNQLYSSVAMDAEGDFVVTWSSNGQDGSGYGVYAQRYNAAGVAQGDEFRVNTTTNVNQHYSSVAMDAEGDFVVTWTSSSQDGNGEGVYAQRYNESGVAQGREFRVNTTTIGNQQYSSVAIDPDGDFIVTWSSNGQDGSGWGVYAQRYNESGVAQGSEFRVNTTTSGNQLYSTVAMDGDGGFVVTWSSNGQQGSGSEVYAQRYNASGVALGTEFRVNSTTSNNQQYSSVAMNADGDFVIDWSSNGQDGSNYGVYAQRYRGNSAPSVTNAIANQTTPENLPFSFTLPANTFNDVDIAAGDSLTYTATLNGNNSLPSWLSFNPTTQTFSGTPVDANVGYLNITVTATDADGASVTDTFNLAVQNVIDGTLAANSLVGTVFDDIINGYAGNDRIDGNDGEDVIDGGVGNDRLTGGVGKDTLTGGLGNDRFIYTDLSDIGDTISDFSNGRDILELSTLFINLGYPRTNAIANGYIELEQTGVNTQVLIYNGEDYSPLVTLNNFAATNLIVGNNLLV
jgi:hypothetical protein